MVQFSGQRSSGSSSATPRSPPFANGGRARYFLFPSAASAVPRPHRGGLLPFATPTKVKHGSSSSGSSKWCLSTTRLRTKILYVVVLLAVVGCLMLVEISLVRIARRKQIHSTLVPDFDATETHPLRTTPVIDDYKKNVMKCRTEANEKWYVLFEFYEGLNNNRYAIMTAVYFAYLTNAILVEPQVPTRTTMCLLGKPCESFHNSTKWYENRRGFDYLYDVEWFREQTKALGVQTTPNLPTNDCNTLLQKECSVEKMNLKLQLRHTGGILASPKLQSPTTCHQNTTRPGFCAKCNIGVIDIGYPQFAFMPNSADEHIFWRRALPLVKHAQSIRTAATVIGDVLGKQHGNKDGKFWSLHLRVEGDWPTGRMGSFGLLAKKLKASGVPRGAAVFVATGSTPHSPEAQEFLHHPRVKALKYDFVFFEDLPEDVRKEHLEADNRELEFRAAVTYEICLHAQAHFGDFMSSFTYNLWVDRTLPTYNVNPTGHSEVVFSKLFGLEEKNEMLGLDTRWGLESMPDLTMWKEE